VRGAVEFAQQHFHDPVNIHQEIDIPNADDAITFRLQNGVTFSVISRVIGVLPAVQFDD
jgi:hypothetical protein